MQVGSKRGRSPEADPAAQLMLDAEGKPRKKLRTSYPAPQFLTVYNHRQTLKQRCVSPPPACALAIAGTLCSLSSQHWRDLLP